MVKKHRKNADIKFYKYFKSASFQRVMILVITWLVLSAVIAYEAAPKKYMLSVGEVSKVDIQAPSDIENTIKTRQSAEEKAEEIEPVVISIETANSDMFNDAYEYFDGINKLVLSVKEDESYLSLDEKIKGYDPDEKFQVLFDMDVLDRQYLFTAEGETEIQHLKNIIIKETLPRLTAKKLMSENLAQEKSVSLAAIEMRLNNEGIKILARDVLNKTLKANSEIDEIATQSKKDAFIESYINENPIIIYKGERIISKDNVVTEDIYEVLKELNYIDNEGKPDYLLYAAVFLIILGLLFISMVYLRNFHPKLYFDKNSVTLLCVVILINTLFAWAFRKFLPDLSFLLIPIFIAPVLIAIFLGVEPAITANILLTFSYNLMIGGDYRFMLMALIGGSFAAFFAVGATQRRKISLSGVILGIINAGVIVLTGIIDKESARNLLRDSGLVFVNGILSIILAMGILPFLESSFNVVTPLKLLELTDPNHPLLKRLLMEAPGTYHHSLMVGNLAEVAAREIGGNALLARVGAYFHDVGKLKRPNFFKENQLSENPHDKLTPNLSTLVITSHAKDGEELALKYRLPKVIRDIIIQHHGTTLVAYFYHKAKQGEKGEEIKEESFRYEGPKPQSREAAIVMLADSVEAAVRSLPDKTQGKIEGLIHKIIKDKLDDGQLDRCDLTLKDLGIIEDSFVQGLSGVFHERLAYPELEKKNTLDELDKSVYGNATK
ncbi:MAG: HDIG domain-containing protein [Clostridiaceae bacterium]|nr:HDIG domain-containing protein [Clostridiaceae bacterium]